MTTFDPGFDIQIDEKKFSFTYGLETFGPEVEKRHLADIRKSLKNPDVEGPEIPYAIAMDVGKKKHLEDLKRRSLLYGAVVYAKGRLGEEPVRSQGHIHAVSASCGQSTPEVYEIWQGTAIIYMQENAKDNPGKCFAITAKAGEVVIVPPNWAHCTVNADSEEIMAFGAWCIRDYAFEYEEVRKHGGLAFYPILNADSTIVWQKNPNYRSAELIEKGAREYPEFKLIKQVPIYQQYEESPDLFDFVTDPQSAEQIWNIYEP